MSGGYCGGYCTATNPTTYISTSSFVDEVKTDHCDVQLLVCNLCETNLIVTDLTPKNLTVCTNGTVQIRHSIDQLYPNCFTLYVLLLLSFY